MIKFEARYSIIASFAQPLNTSCQVGSLRNSEIGTRVFESCGRLILFVRFFATEPSKRKGALAARAEQSGYRTNPEQRPYLWDAFRARGSFYVAAAGMKVIMPLLARSVFVWRRWPLRRRSGNRIDRARSGEGSPRACARPRRSRSSCWIAAGCADPRP